VSVEDGVVHSIDALEVGIAAWRLGRDVLEKRTR